MYIVDLSFYRSKITEFDPLLFADADSISAEEAEALDPYYDDWKDGSGLRDDLPIYK